MYACVCMYCMQVRTLYVYVCGDHFQLPEPTGQRQGRVPVLVLQVHVAALLRLPHQPLQQSQVAISAYEQNTSINI